MTSTIQLTQSQPPTQVLYLHAMPQTPEKKLKLLLQEMKAACNTLPPPFNEEMPKNFAAWENQFFNQFKSANSTEREKILCATHLAALYSRVESIMLFAGVSDASQLLWQKLCTDLKERLSEVLPKNRPVERFLATYRQRETDKKYLNEIAKIKLLFSQLRNQLYLQANSINEELMTGFIAIQEKMILVQDATNLSTQQIYELLNKHTRDVTQLFLGFDGHMKEMKPIADLLKQHGIDLGHTLTAAETVLNKV